MGAKRKNRKLFGLRSYLLDSRQMDDRYETFEALSKSLGTVVYKAYDRKADRFVALKVIEFESPKVIINREDFRRRWLRMCKYARKLKHKNILNILDHGIDYENNILFYSTEYIPGETLANRELLGQLELRDRYKIALALIEAINYAHRNGVIHRDIKPSNIIVDYGKRPYLIDFGAAKFEDLPITRSGSTFGTPAYMSPEQIQGQKLDFRSDIFSLGNVFYYLFTEKSPFEGKNNVELSERIVNLEPKPIWKINDAVDRDLSEKILIMMRKTPGQRQKNLNSLKRQLRRLLAKS